MNYRRITKRKSHSPRFKQLKGWLPTTVFVVALGLFIFIGNPLQNPHIGEMALAAYGLVMLVLRPSSTLHFRFGIICLLAVPFVNGARNDVDLAQTVAIYAFTLLMIAVSLALEEQFLPATWCIFGRKSAVNLQKSLEN